MNVPYFEDCHCVPQSWMLSCISNTNWKERRGEYALELSDNKVGEMISNVGFRCLNISLRFSVLTNKTVRNWNNLFKLLTPRTYKQIHISTVVQEGEGCGPPQSFWYVAVFRNDFTLNGKPLIFLTRWGIFYGRWRLLETCDVTNMMIVLLATILDFTKN